METTRERAEKAEVQVVNYRRAARECAVSALNGAVGWDEHPSYNTRTDVLIALRGAQAVLTVIATAETERGQVFPDAIVGINWRMINDVIELVKKRDVYTGGAIRAAVVRTIVRGDFQ